MNGVGNDGRGFNENLLHVGRLADHNVVGVHSPSFGIGWDAVRYGAGRFHIATESAQQIGQLWMDFFEKFPKGYVCWTCHSRGVVDTRNALITFPPHLRERITVIAVAPGCFIEKHLCGRIMHLVSTRDVVPCLDLNGMIRCWNSIEFLNPSSMAPTVDHPFMSDTYTVPLQNKYRRFYEDHR